MVYDALAIESILANGFKIQKTSDTLIFQIHTKLTVGGAGLSGIAPTASASVTHLDQTQIDTGHSFQVKSICLNKLPYSTFERLKIGGKMYKFGIG
jgi:hypothetical protein